MHRNSSSLYDILTTSKKFAPRILVNMEERHINNLIPIKEKQAYQKWKKSKAEVKVPNSDQKIIVENEEP